MMLTTGMLMSGKMSVGVRKMARPPKRKTSTASTAIVYGCLNASLTIHIAQIPPADNQSAQCEALQLECHGLGNKPAKSLRANELASFTRRTGQPLFNLLNKEAVGLSACRHAGQRFSVRPKSPRP